MFVDFLWEYKMKKLFLFFLVAAAISAHSFAAEFILSPTIGFSNTSSIGIAVAQEGSHAGDRETSKMYFNHMPVGITLGLVTDKGFTFMVNNDFSPIGKGTMKLEDDSGNLKLDKNIIFQQSVIFGYTFKLINQKLFINIGSGFIWGAGRIKPYSFESHGYLPENMPLVTFGIPVQAGAQFFFTKNIGINLMVTDALGFAVGNLGKNSNDDRVYSIGFSYMGTVKVGPVFKF